MSSEERRSRSRRHKNRDRGKKEKKSKKSRSISSESSRSRSSSRSSSSPQPRKKVKKSNNDSDTKKKGRGMEEEQKPQKNYPGMDDVQSGPRNYKPGGFNQQTGGRPPGKNFNTIGMHPPQKGTMNMYPSMMGMGMNMGMPPMPVMMMQNGNMPGTRGPMADMMDPNMWAMNSFYGPRMPGVMMHNQMHMPVPLPVKRPSDPGPIDNKNEKTEKAKEVPKEVKKETKYIEMLHLPTSMQIMHSLQFTVNGAKSVLTVNTIKKILKELEEKCKDKKLKSTAKDIADFLAEYDAKPSKEDQDSKGSHHHAKKITELEFIEAMSQAEDLKSLFKTVDATCLPEIAINFTQDNAEIFEEEDNAYEDAKDMFLSNLPKSYL